MKELTIKDIQTKIITLPNRPPFMLGHQLAAIYQVKPEQISQAVRRHLDRFPEDFCFLLTDEEKASLQFEGMLSYQGGQSPRGFTRNGANQLSSVLRSTVADARSVQIIRAFSDLEEMAEQGKPLQQEAAPAMQPGFRIIPDDEYIGLLKDRNNLLQESNELLRQRLDDVANRPKTRVNFTPEEDAMALRLHSQGFSPREIGNKIGKKIESVRSCLRRLKGVTA